MGGLLRLVGAGIGGIDPHPGRLLGLIGAVVGIRDPLLGHGLVGIASGRCRGNPLLVLVTHPFLQLGQGAFGVVPQAGFPLESRLQAGIRRRGDRPCQPRSRDQGAAPARAAVVQLLGKPAHARHDLVQEIVDLALVVPPPELRGAEGLVQDILGS